MVLKRMKRRHTRAQVIEFCQEVRSLRPEVSFGADIIAGFPTEDEVMFENTHQLVHEADLQFLHVFPYSAREGTPAARMPQVPGNIRKERAALLREAGKQRLQAFLEKKVSKEVEVLVEKGHIGRCEDFTEVVLDRDCAVGSIVPVKLLGVEEQRLLGQV
jgi:threonylcarbamoyladenosine tRNA methylthiotransferase MtaB